MLQRLLRVARACAFGLLVFVALLWLVQVNEGERRVAAHGGSCGPVYTCHSVIAAVMTTGYGYYWQDNTCYGSNAPCEHTWVTFMSGFNYDGSRDYENGEVELLRPDEEEGCWYVLWTSETLTDANFEWVQAYLTWLNGGSDHVQTAYNYTGYTAVQDHLEIDGNGPQPLPSSWGCY